jgi:seryl-tRNA synthetase
MDLFHENVKRWVEVDTQLKLVQEKAKQLRERRNELAEQIHDHVNDHDLSNAIVNISDGKLRFTKTKHTSPLTLKFTEECLKKCIGNQAQIAHIMDTIKDSRNVEYCDEIKRTYNK